MRPKGKLLTLLAIFVAIGLVTASGAFTSTSVDRTMDISVAADSSALLGLAPNSSSVNGGYATETNGRIEVTVSGANLDADTHIDHVVNLTNNGNADITVWATMSGNNTSAVTLYNGTVSGGTAIPSSNPGVTVSVGETISVSIQIDTTGTNDSPGDTLVDTVTFHAESV